MNAIALIIVCLSVWGLFQLLAVLIGWRFTAMRPAFDAAVQVRAEAITEWEKSDVKDRPDWDHEDVEAMATLTREVVEEERDEEDEDAEAEHFLRWHAELTGRRRVAKRIAKYGRRMDRWSQ